MSKHTISREFLIGFLFAKTDYSMTQLIEMTNEELTNEATIYRGIEEAFDNGIISLDENKENLNELEENVIIDSTKYPKLANLVVEIMNNNVNDDVIPESFDKLVELVKAKTDKRITDPLLQKIVNAVQTLENNLVDDVSEIYLYVMKTIADYIFTSKELNFAKRDAENIITSINHGLDVLQYVLDKANKELNTADNLTIAVKYKYMKKYKYNDKSDVKVLLPYNMLFNPTPIELVTVREMSQYAEDYGINVQDITRKYPDNESDNALIEINKEIFTSVYNSFGVSDEMFDEISEEKCECEDCAEEERNQDSVGAYYPDSDDNIIDIEALHPLMKDIVNEYKSRHNRVTDIESVINTVLHSIYSHLCDHSDALTIDIENAYYLNTIAEVAHVIIGKLTTIMNDSIYSINDKYVIVAKTRIESKLESYIPLPYGLINVVTHRDFKDNIGRPDLDYSKLDVIDQLKLGAELHLETIQKKLKAKTEHITKKSVYDTIPFNAKYFSTKSLVDELLIRGGVESVTLLPESSYTVDIQKPADSVHTNVYFNGKGPMTIAFIYE